MKDETQKVTLNYEVILDRLCFSTDSEGSVIYGKRLMDIGIVCIETNPKDSTCLHWVFTEQDNAEMLQKTAVVDMRTDSNWRDIVSCETTLRVPRKLAENEKTVYRPALFFVDGNGVLYAHVATSKVKSVSKESKGVFTPESVYETSNGIVFHECELAGYDVPFLSGLEPRETISVAQNVVDKIVVEKPLEITTVAIKDEKDKLENLPRDFTQTEIHQKHTEIVAMFLNRSYDIVKGDGYEGTVLQCYAPGYEGLTVSLTNKPDRIELEAVNGEFFEKASFTPDEEIEYSGLFGVMNLLKNNLESVKPEETEDEEFDDDASADDGESEQLTDETNEEDDND